MTVYCISGLGADHRAFERLTWPESTHVVYLPWLEPLPKESLSQYAQRLAEPIITHEPFVLVGLSFGGIISVELLQWLKPEKTILLSSIADAAQLPWYFRLAGKTGLHQTALAKQLKQNQWFIDSLFGQKNTPLALYLKEHFAAMSDNYLTWSLDSILNWGQNEKPRNVIQIHGSADRVFPIEYAKPDVVIRGGSHFMVYTHAKQVSKHIHDLLNYHR